MYLYIVYIQMKLDWSLSSLQNIFILGLLFKFYSRSQSVLRVRNLYLINFAKISEYFFYDIYVWRIQIFFWIIIFEIFFLSFVEQWRIITY